MQKSWNSREELSLSHLSTLQSSNEGTGLVSAGANSLRPALPEQTGHAGFIRQTETLLVLEQEERKLTFKRY